MRRSSQKISPPTSAVCRISPSSIPVRRITTRSFRRCGRRRQTPGDIGLDIINEGEFTKHGDWLRYAEGRLAGCEPRRCRQRCSRKAARIGRSLPRSTNMRRSAARCSTGRTRISRAALRSCACTGPITYRGAGARCSARSILFRAALGGQPLRDAFLTTTAPASLEPYRKNEFYKSDEEFVYAIAEAMRIEYEMIARAGFLAAGR